MNDSLPRATSNGRLLLLAMALSVVLHGVAIVGTPRFAAVDVEPLPKPPLLEVNLIVPPASPPQTPARAKPRPVAPQIKTVKVGHEPRLLARATPAVQQAVPQPAAVIGVPEDAPAVVTVAAEVDTAPPSASPVSVPPAEPYPLAQARLVFDLYYGESQTLIGEVVQSFESEGDRYVATSIAEAVGFVSLFLGGRHVQRSEGRIGPHGLVPERYTVQERGATEPERAIYDWPRGVMRFERKNRVREVPLSPGAQDLLSAVHQLHFLQPLQPDWHMDVATTRKLESMLFMNLGHDEVETALGPTQAVHVKRQDPDGDLTEIWLDPQRYLLPVRVYSRNRRGHVLLQVLREASLVRPGDAPAEP